MVNPILKTLSPAADEVLQSIISEAVSKLVDDDECKEIVSANSRDCALSYLSSIKKSYVLGQWVDRVEKAHNVDDITSQALSELLKTLGDSMEKIMTREALEVAFPA